VTPEDYQMNIELIFGNKYLAVSYIDFRRKESYRERFELFAWDEKK
jgi:hypothetical protein